MSEHAKGPWLFYERKSTVSHWGAVSADGRLIAEVYGDTTDQALANGRLMAAAPELLAACRAISEAWDDGYDESVLMSIQAAMPTVIAAIAQATRQPPGDPP